VSMQHALILEMCHMLFTPFIFVHRRLPRPSLSLPSLSPWLARSLARSLALAVYLSVSLFSFALVAVRYIFLSLLRFPRSFVPRSSFLSLPLLTYSLPFTPPPAPCPCLHAALPFSLLFLSGLLAAVSPRSYAVTRPLPPTFAKSLLVSLLGLSCIRYLVRYPLLRFTRATLISLPSVSLFSFTLS